MQIIAQIGLFVQTDASSGRDQAPMKPRPADQPLPSRRRRRMSQDRAESLTESDKIGVRSGLLRDSSLADPDHGSGADSEAVEGSRQLFILPGIRGGKES